MMIWLQMMSTVQFSVSLRVDVVKDLWQGLSSGSFSMLETNHQLSEGSLIAFVAIITLLSW